MAKRRRERRRGTSAKLGERAMVPKLKWLKRNRAALDAYNEYAEKHGVFSDGLRSF